MGVKIRINPDFDELPKIEPEVTGFAPYAGGRKFFYQTYNSNETFVRATFRFIVDFGLLFSIGFYFPIVSIIVLFEATVSKFSIITFIFCLLGFAGATAWIYRASITLSPSISQFYSFASKAFFQTPRHAVYFNNQRLFLFHKIINIFLKSCCFASVFVFIWFLVLTVIMLINNQIVTPGQSIELHHSLIAISFFSIRFFKTLSKTQNNLIEKGNRTKSAFPGISDRRLVCSDDNKRKQVYKVAHISDLHMTSRNDIKLVEGCKSRNKIIEALFERIIELENNFDLLLITGDITDTGSRIEWQNWIKIFNNKIPHNVINKTLILPGNHDINILPKKSEIHGNDFLLRKERIIRFFSAVNTIQGERALVWPEYSECPIRLSSFYSEIESKLKEFIENPPIRKFRIERTGSHSYERFDISDRKDLMRLNEIEEIWSSTFPMAVPLSDGQGVIILIDSCQLKTRTIIDNAVGEVSSRAIRRIRKFVDYYHNSDSSTWMIYAMHHHLSLPLKKLSLKDLIANPFMTLLNGDELFEALPVDYRSILFHGHRHIGYIGVADTIEIVSAPSSSLGDSLMSKDNREPGFFIYSLTNNLNKGVELLSQSRFNV